MIQVTGLVEFEDDLEFSMVIAGTLRAATPILGSIPNSLRFRIGPDAWGPKTNSSEFCTLVQVVLDHSYYVGLELNWL